MRVRISLLLPAVSCCLLLASPARATDYAYGYTSVYVDSGGVVRGYHRTEVDYNTDVYYRPYVCGSLYKDGAEVVRACQGGFASATRQTQTTYSEGSSYSALSDHYVDIEYEEEDPYNPGYYYYQDYFGYSFGANGSHPDFWYFVPAGIYYQRPDQSVRLGDTNVVLRAITVGRVSVSPTTINTSTDATLSITLFASSGIQSTSGTTLEVGMAEANGSFQINFSPATYNVMLSGGESHTYTFNVHLASAPSSPASGRLTAVLTAPATITVINPATSVSQPLTIQGP